MKTNLRMSQMRRAYESSYRAYRISEKIAMAQKVRIGSRRHFQIYDEIHAHMGGSWIISQRAAWRSGKVRQQLESRSVTTARVTPAPVTLTSHTG